MASISRDSLKVSAGGSVPKQTSFAVKSNSEDNTISAENVKTTKNRNFITSNELAYLHMVIDKFSDDENGNLEVEYADRADDANWATNSGHADKADEANSANYAHEAEKVEWDNIQNIPEPFNNTLQFNEQFQSIKNNEHVHSNQGILDIIDEDSEGKVTYNGQAWPYAENSEHAEVAEEANKVNWDNIENKPEALDPTYNLKAKVDSLITNQHDHTDKDALNLIGSQMNNGILVPTWQGLNWPGANGDMVASLYDSENNGIVNEARKVKWEGTSEGRPTEFPPEAHKHSFNDVIEDTNHRFVTDAQISKWNLKQDPITIDSSKIESIDHKGQASGYVPLDTSAKIDKTYLYATTWDELEQKPASSTNDIDEAVAKKHEHTLNIDALNKLNKSADDDPLPTWDGHEWPYPGDMKKSEFVEDGKIKVAKVAESIAWNNVTGRPNKSVSDIEQSVSWAHTHSNRVDINKIGTDASTGNPTWNGNEWPFDMKKSEYASSEEGTVNKAIEAKSVPWSGITAGPSSTKEDIDNAVNMKHNHSNSGILDKFGEDSDTSRPTYYSNGENKQIALYNDIEDKITTLGSSNTTGSIIFKNGKYQLDNDINSVGLSKYYGTGPDSNAKGYYPLPQVEVENSLQMNNKKISLKGDKEIALIAPMSYYGTNSNNELGYHEFANNESDEVLTSGIRQCVISGRKRFMSYDSENINNILIEASIDNPIIINFANGKNDIIKSITSNKTIVVANGTSYIYAEINNDVVSVNITSLKPIYSKDEPINDISEGQYWFDLNTYTMKKYDGTNYNKVLAVFIGSVEYNGSQIKVNQYAINGIYDSGCYVAINSPQSHCHNIGTDLVTITAYKCNDDNNIIGLFESGINNDNELVGDVIVEFDSTNIKTVRKTSIAATNESPFIGTSTQHRVIVKRAF